MRQNCNQNPAKNLQQMHHFPTFSHLALSVCPPLSQSRKMIEMPFSFNIGFKYLLRCSRATSPAAAATWNPFLIDSLCFLLRALHCQWGIKTITGFGSNSGGGVEKYKLKQLNPLRSVQPVKNIAIFDYRPKWPSQHILSEKNESKRNAEQAKVPVNHPLIETNGCLISHTTRLEPNVFSSRKHSEHSVLVHQSSKVKERIVENSLNWTRLIGIVSSLPGCEEQIPRFRHWGGQVLSCAQSSGEAKAGRNMATNKNGQLV